jgi:hypothetical protein
MSRRGFRDRWRAEVIRSTTIPDSTKVLLIVLADTMTDAGMVSVPRTALAKALNRSPKRVTERIKLAHEAGYLDTVRSGKPGRTAEYQAVLPGESHGAPVRTNRVVRFQGPSMVQPSAPPKLGQHGAPVGPTNARTYLNNQPPTRSEHNGTFALPLADVTNGAPTKAAVKLSALDVAKRITCWDCNLLGTRDETASPCDQHRETA